MRVLPTLADVKRFAVYYLESDVSARNPYVSPIRASNFKELLDATVVTTGFDSLCNEGIAYADTTGGLGIAEVHWPNCRRADRRSSSSADKPDQLGDFGLDYAVRRMDPDGVRESVAEVGRPDTVPGHFGGLCTERWLDLMCRGM